MSQATQIRDLRVKTTRPRLTREEGVALVKKFDQEFPSRFFPEMLDYINMTEDEFSRRVNKSRWWRNPFTRPKHKTASVVTNLVYAVG